MVAVVHDFPSKTSALQFEWAWQHPDRDRHIRGNVGCMPLVSRRTAGVRGKLTLAKAMLQLQPWSRYGLGIRFLREEFAKSFRAINLPPTMLALGLSDVCISVGSHDGLQVYQGFCEESQSSDSELTGGHMGRGNASINNGSCGLCRECFEFGEVFVECNHCWLAAHIRCLSRCFTQQHGDLTELIPREGRCPGHGCGKYVLWADVVRRVQRHEPSEDSVAAVTCSSNLDGCGTSRRRLPYANVWLVDDSSNGSDMDGNGSTDSDGDNSADEDALDTNKQQLLQGQDKDACIALNTYDFDLFTLDEPPAKGRLSGSTLESLGGEHPVEDIESLTWKSVPDKSCQSAVVNEAKSCRGSSTANPTSAVRCKPQSLVLSTSDHSEGGTVCCEQLDSAVFSPTPLTLIERLELRRAARNFVGVLEATHP